MQLINKVYWGGALRDDTFKKRLCSRVGNPRTPQSLKTVTANVPQIRRVTIACQVTLDSRGRVELFIYKSLSQQH